MSQSVIQNMRHAHHIDVLCLRSFELQLDFTVLDANWRTCNESSFCGATEHRNRTRRCWANCDDETAAHMPISPPTIPSVLVKGVIGQFEGAARQHSGESKYQSFDSRNCWNVLHCDALNVRSVTRSNACAGSCQDGILFRSCEAYAIFLPINICGW